MTRNYLHYRGICTEEGELKGKFVTGVFDPTISWIIADNLSDDTPAIDGQKFLVDTDTVTQSTGICDRNGSFIFEGDIVQVEEVKNISSFNAVVVWIQTEAAFFLQCVNLNDSRQSTDNDGSFAFIESFRRLTQNTANHCLVVGNIFQNSDPRVKPC